MGKDYPKAFQAHLKELVRANLRRKSLHMKKRSRSFDLMLAVFEAGVATDKDDKALRNIFQKAKLNVEDPFHWWELLHLFVAVHTNKPPGARVLWDEEFKEQLVRDCVQLGRAQSGKSSIAKLCKDLTDPKGRYRYRQTSENLETQISRFGLGARISDAVRKARKKRPVVATR